MAGQLDVKKEKIIEEHLAQCPECAKRIFELEHIFNAKYKKGVAASDEDGSSEMIAHDTRSSRESTSDSNSFTSGDVLDGHLRLEEKLSRGGMGEAWKASDLSR